MADCPRCGRDNPDEYRFCCDCHCFLGRNHTIELVKPAASAPLSRPDIAIDTPSEAERQEEVTISPENNSTVFARQLLYLAAALALLVLAFILIRNTQSDGLARRSLPQEMPASTDIVSPPGQPATRYPSSPAGPPKPAEAGRVDNPAVLQAEETQPRRDAEIPRGPEEKPAPANSPAADAAGPRLPEPSSPNLSGNPGDPGTRPGGTPPPSAPPGYAPPPTHPNTTPLSPTAAKAIIDLDKPLAPQTPQVIPHD